MPKLTTLDALRLAIEHHKSGDYQAAEHIYRKVLVKDTNNADALHLLGVLLRQTGRVRTGIDLLKRSVEHSPNIAQFHNHLGQALRDLGRAEEAVDTYRTALALDPNYAEAHNNLGQALHDLHHTPQAITAFRKAISLAPEVPDPHANLAHALLDIGRVDEAAGECRAALRINPDFPDAHNNLGNCLVEQGAVDEAIEHYRKAVASAPYFQLAWSNLLYTLHASSSYDARAIFEEHREWGRLLAEPLFNGVDPQRDPNPDRRLKLGYVSPDFKDHPIGRFIAPLLASHDRAQFEVHCFSDVLNPDAHTRTLQSHADHWHITSTYSDEEVAEFVRNHHIDILIDLRLHVSPNRLLVFARKPAPVQMTYLAYPGTSGLRTMDYRLTDAQLDPADAPSVYTERALAISGSYWCYEAHAQTPEVAPLPAQRSGFVTFGCLNPIWKVSVAAFAVWRELLNRVPNSKLLLHALPGSHRDRMQNGLAQHQIPPQRLEFVGKQSFVDFLKTYSRIDIALDPFPFPGGATTCDALYMGVPVVTVAQRGAGAVGRMGASILASAGLQSFIAQSTEDYIRIAQTCAHEPAKLATLRAQLRARVTSSKLMDKTACARGIETAYRHAWRAWCAGNRSSGHRPPQ